MAFCSFSKDYADNTYTCVDNRFITKYLPEADALSVKVYIYGLFLCGNPGRDVTAEAFAEKLNIPEDKVIEAFRFWEDCDLVQILSEKPLVLVYLPLSSSGRPKRVRHEEFADFNKELQRKMQTVGKFLDYGELQKYMSFVQKNEMEQQAFLLIVEYCVQYYGEGVTRTAIFNKAKNFISRGLLTYGQVEQALSDFNVHTADIRRILAAIGSYRQEPDDGDYALLSGWLAAGFDMPAVLEAAKSVKHGSMKTLGAVLSDLQARGLFTAGEIAAFTQEKERLYSATYRVARKLGVKAESPAAYADEYLRVWAGWGFSDVSALCSLASLCMRTERASFSQMNALLEQLHRAGYSDGNIREYLTQAEGSLKLLTQIQAVCPSARRNGAGLDAVSVWRGWGFSDGMILEAANRASGAQNPVSYMYSILLSWKKENAFSPAQIPEKRQPSSPAVSPAVAAADGRAERERFYAARRDQAEGRARENEGKALADPEYREIASELAGAEREAAKAEAFGREDTLPALQEKAESLRAKKAEALARLGLSEEDLIPRYACPRCSDTGFTPDGRACTCYSER